MSLAVDTNRVAMRVDDVVGLTVCGMRHAVSRVRHAVSRVLHAADERVGRAAYGVVVAVVAVAGLAVRQGV